MKISKSTVFSVVAAAGVVATFIFTTKAAPKAKKKVEAITDYQEEPSKIDIVKAVAPVYAPAITIGLVTILCIFESNHLNRKQQAALTSAYMFATESHRRYKDKLIELYGEDVHNTIMDELMVETAKEQEIFAEGLCSRFSNKDMYDPEKPRLFYDRYSQRYFESTVGAVLDAEYHLNRNYVLGGIMTLNDFYNFLGLKDVTNGDILGWDAGDSMEGIYWLDFDHRVTNIDTKNGGQVECIVLDMVFDPQPIDESYCLK